MKTLHLNNLENKTDNGQNDSIRKMVTELEKNGVNNITLNKPVFNKKEYDKHWRLNNRERIRETYRFYVKNNPIKIKEWKSRYYKKNKVKLYEKLKNRINTDIEFKTRRTLRSRFKSAIAGKYKSGSAVRDLGCSIEEFLNYIESKFQPGMTWRNYGKWHYDHITPLSWFNLEDRNQVMVALHYTNYQPLWANDNWIKSNS